MGLPKVGRQVERAETVRKVRKNAAQPSGNEIQRRDRERTAVEEKKMKKKRANNPDGKEEADGFASGGVCEFGVRPLSLPPDKHRFAYDRHFAGSII